MGVVDKLGWTERIGFGAGDLAQNLVFSAVGTYFLFFCTDVMGVAPSSAATMFLVVQLADALWNPFVGVFIDRRSPPWGKYRSYLVMAGIPFAAFAVMCFANPFGGAWKMIYACAAYAGFTLLFTLVNVAYGALSASLTCDADEITTLTAVRIFLANLTFTVRAKGEVSGKVIFKDKSYSFTSQLSYSTPNWSQFSPSIKIGKTTYKPGKVMIYEFEDLETTVNAQVEGGTMEFCAYKRPGLVVEEGSLAVVANWRCDLTDEAAGANLQVLFQNGDTVLVSGTVGSKTVGCSSQLCLKASYNNGTSDCYDVVAPVVLYKNKFYRALYFTFVRHANGDVEPAVKEIRDISEMNY